MLQTGKQFRLGGFYLRKWQQKALLGYIERFNKKQIEVTVAHQGSGKTLYAAACYVLSTIESSTLQETLVQLPLSQIRKQFNLLKHQRSGHFAIVFVPSHSIVSSTIRDWQELGVFLVKLDNLALTQNSISDLKTKGVDGIVVTYQQAISNGYGSIGLGVWKNNHLVRFIKKAKGIKIHAVLDECHNLTIRLKNDGDVQSTLGAKFFLSNASIFNKIHMISGTPAKKPYYSLGTLVTPRIPFANYTNDNLLLPDTWYSKQDSENDNNIVKTNIIVHKLERSEIVINGEIVELTDDSLAWYSENATSAAMKNGYHPKHKTLKNIEKALNAAYSDLGLWQQLLFYGEKKLTEIKNLYEPAIGIIFAPGADVATKIHKELLFSNSVLCLGDSKNAVGCKFVKSKSITEYLDTNKSNIRWVVSCESLKEGFDYPNCKVSILLPRLAFLSMTKISQMLGRTNRSIPEHDNLQAVSVTLNYKPVIELINNDIQGKYGLCSPETAYNDILETHNQEVIDIAKDKSKAALEIKRYYEPTILIKDLLLGAEASLLTTDGSENVDYDLETNLKIKELRIRSYWTRWSDIVYEDKDIPEHKIPPKNIAGIYVMINANTQEYLYVGKSHDLYQRISDLDRFNKCAWVKTEGYKNIFTKWIICDNYHEKEVMAKAELNPKYDDEKHAKY